MSTTPTYRQQLESAIGALEAQRALLGDALVEAALAPLRAKLAASDIGRSVSSAQTLKQVTVLFLDMVGSTALARHLDPEDIQAVMDGALARFTAIVDAHRGKVLQYAGDSLLAVFGAKEAQEDDVERAVRCGLALIDEGRAQGEHVKRQHGYDGFDVRVGLHTGGVLLGGGADEEGTIRGITVNVAARMEQTAPAGRMRISHDSYRHVRGVFDVEPQESMQVKGLDEPIVTYLVTRAKPRAFRVVTRGIEGVETRMIGRDVELEQLQDAFRSIHREPRLTTITVIAEAGIGKSRLLYEFENWAETRAERFTIFQARANPQTQNRPYGLLRDVLAWRLQIADNDSMDGAKRKIEGGIASLFTADDGEDLAEAHAHLLGHLIGLDFSNSRHVKGIVDDGAQIRNRGFHAAAQMFRRIAAHSGTPIVLLLDDLHWADDGSLDFLNYLMQVDHDVPMLMLALARPTLFERRADWAGSSDATRIGLAALDKGSSRLLANELLKKLDSIPPALRELVTGGAEGNPFYMEELVKMLVDEGAIDTRQERWAVVPDKLVAAHVPQTLTGVLQARLDGLAPEEKRALQQASVIGFVFWDAALAAIESRAVDALPSLVLRELAVPHADASLDDVREYAFKHQILHQVTYDTLLKRDKREAHAKVAAWLAGLSGARASNFLGITAEHYEKAGDAPNAVEYFTRAAENAAARYGHEAALDHVERALALLGDAEDRDALLTHWRLHDIRERTFELKGLRGEQRAAIEKLQGLAEALDDDRRRGVVALRSSTLAMRTSDYPAMRSVAQEAMRWGERLGDVELKLRGQQRLAVALSWLGYNAEAEAIALDGLASSRAAGLPAVESLLLNALGNVAAQRNDDLTALEISRQNLNIERKAGDRVHEVTELTNIGAAELGLGMHEEARLHLEEGLKVARAIGHRMMEQAALGALSVLALREGDDATALAHARSARSKAIAVQSPMWEAYTYCRLGEAELALGRHDEAAAAFEQARAIEIARDPDSAHQHDASAGLARVALAKDDVPGALQALQATLARLSEDAALEGAESPHRIRLTCYHVLVRAHDARAGEVLATAYRILQEHAERITDAALREGFLNNVPEHREIVAAWAQRVTAS